MIGVHTKSAKLTICLIWTKVKVTSNNKENIKNKLKDTK